MTAIIQSKPKAYFLIGTIVLIACILLFSLDKEMHRPSDYFDPGNLIALVIYFAPTFLLSSLLFGRFTKKYDHKESLFLSLFIGIIIGFALVICSLMVLMAR